MILAAPYLLVMGYVGIDDVVTDALLITHQLNGSWWFMQTYVIFVVSFPMFRKSLDARWCWMILLLGALTFFQPLAVFLRPYNENVHYIFFYFPLFYSGMVVQRFSVIEKVDGKHWWVKVALWVAVLGMRFVLGLHIMNVGIIMMMVVLLMDLQTFLTDRIKKLFGFLGLMSMNMWLVHQFFIDYGWHSSNPFLDLGVLYLESLGISFVLAKVYERIVGLVNFK